MKEFQIKKNVKKDSKIRECTGKKKIFPKMVC
jgi:hypothetical protein